METHFNLVKNHFIASVRCFNLRSFSSCFDLLEERFGHISPLLLTCEARVKVKSTVLGTTV